MSEKRENSGIVWVDPDDAPEWTDDMFDRAEHAKDDECRVIKHATGTVMRGPGRPPLAHSKTRLTLRLDTEIVASISVRPDQAGRRESMTL